MTDLPGEIQRRIDAGEMPDPIWYVGRAGPSVQDILDAEGDELLRLQGREPAVACATDERHRRARNLKGETSP